jgi:hypothetical protein
MEARCRQKLEVYERPGSQAPKPLTCTLPLCNTAQPFPTTAMLTLSSAIYEDNQNNLWLGTASGIWRWKPGSPKHYPLPALMRSRLPGLIFARHAIIEGDKGALRVAGRLPH